MVRVLVLGGTGSIGAAIVGEFVRRGHRVDGLARSDGAAAKLAALGATALPGDIGTPERWMGALPRFDAIIHAACDFGTAMGETDRHLLDTILPALAAAQRPRKPRFIYTGGCWLFGATGDVVATERSPFRPLPAFAWMVPQLRRVLAAEDIGGIVIHPAMVYEPGGGVFRRFAEDAASGSAIRIVGCESVRWPLVHSADLAALYALALERGAAGSSYIGAAIDGLPVGSIARAFARRLPKWRREPRIIGVGAVAAELGNWARGYALDQQLSGAKARRELGWEPRHLDPEGEIARLP
jgi:nucleoside-diphosphate-sugar epimerase